MDRPAIHRVVHHHCHGIRTAFRMCRRKGFKRIGLALSNDSDLRSNRLWSAGYLGIQHALPKSQQVNLLLTSNSAWSPETVEKWILKEKPDLVIFHALGCFPEMERVLKNLPFKVAHAVLGLEPGDPCPGIDQQSCLSGRLLVDLLSSQIRHNDRGIPRTPTLSMIDGVWVDHPSCVPRSDKSA
jgi:LacI family transcriptional regulator